MGRETGGQSGEGGGRGGRGMGGQAEAVGSLPEGLSQQEPLCSGDPVGTDSAQDRRPDLTLRSVWASPLSPEKAALERPRTQERRCTGKATRQGLLARAPGEGRGAPEHRCICAPGLPRGGQGSLNCPFCPSPMALPPQRRQTGILAEGELPELKQRLRGHRSPLTPRCGRKRQGWPWEAVRALRRNYLPHQDTRRPGLAESAGLGGPQGSRTPWGRAGFLCPLVPSSSP